MVVWRKWLQGAIDVPLRVVVVERREDLEGVIDELRGWVVVVVVN